MGSKWSHIIHNPLEVLYGLLCFSPLFHSSFLSFLFFSLSFCISSLSLLTWYISISLMLYDFSFLHNQQLWPTLFLWNSVDITSLSLDRLLQKKNLMLNWFFSPSQCTFKNNFNLKRHIKLFGKSINLFLNTFFSVELLLKTFICKTFKEL